MFNTNINGRILRRYRNRASPKEAEPSYIK